MLHRFSEMMTQDAATRYKSFVSQNGALLQRITLGDLAAYLGITQASLSRIRTLR